VPLFSGPTLGSAGGGGGSGNFNAAAIDAAPPAGATALSDHVPASQAGVLVFETPQQLLDAIGLLATAGAVAGANLLPLSQAGVSKSLSLTALKAAFDVGGGLALGYSQTSGTVTSVACTVPSWLTIGGSPITAAGTLAIIATPAQTAAQVVATSGTAVSSVNLRALTKEHLAGAGATTGALGAVQLAGDLGGTAASPTVVGVNGVALPVGVASGGSGLATLATFALLAGGTTATGALQQVSGLGTSGQVLTSNGAAALPTWQAAAGGGLSNPLGAGSLGAASLQLGAAGDGLWQPATHIVGIQANSFEVLRAEAAASSVNYLRAIASATTAALQLAAAGTDTNIPIKLVPKGTGAVQFADGTAAAPSIAFPGGAGIGFYSGATNAVGIPINGNPRIYLDAGGDAIFLRSSGAYSFASTADASHPGGMGAGLSMPSAGSLSFDTTATGNALGRAHQRTSTAANATTTEYPNDKDWGIHKNTSSGNIFLVHNNGGTIVSVQLS
jgi:hypothetical protein